MSKIMERALLTFLLLSTLLLLLGCAGLGSQETSPSSSSPLATSTSTPPPAATPASGPAAAPEVATLAQIAPSRIPEPTATPDALTMAADEVAQQTGHAGTTFFGLDIEDWFSLAASLLLVLVAFLEGTWMERWLIPRLTARTNRILMTSCFKKLGMLCPG